MLKFEPLLGPQYGMLGCLHFDLTYCIVVFEKILKYFIYVSKMDFEPLLGPNHWWGR